MDSRKQGYPIRVGLLYGHEPSGHCSAARAIADFFPASVIEPVFMDLSEAYPNLGSLVSRTYLEILKKTPGLWDYIYDNDFVALAVNSLKKAVFPYYAKKLTDVLRKKNLQAMVSTHAFTTMLLTRQEELLAEAVGRKGSAGTHARHAPAHVPLFAVLTDFYAHSYWPARGVDLYFSSGKTAESGLKANGVDAAGIINTGIPVRKEFLIPADARQKRKEIGLAPNLFTVLIAGGSKGLGDIGTALETLKKYLGKIQIIVMCGENKELCGSLEKRFGGLRHLKIVGGFVEYPADNYKAADIVLGKAGGVTIAEAMALNKPMLLFSSFPGQEERNTRFLVKNRLADLAEDAKQLETMVRRYMTHPGSLSVLKANIAAAARPHAASDIAAKIMERLLERNEGSIRDEG